MADFSKYDFAPVMDYPEPLYVFDLTENYDPEFIRTKEWAVGRYNEKRKRMYRAEQYRGMRNIHMGIDIWTREGTPVYSFYDGVLVYLADHQQEGNYGPTLVVKHELRNATLFALYGHLSRESLKEWKTGLEIKKGQQIATLGSEKVNGGWVPHLHFQLSREDPGEADMPGVVADDFHKRALKLYPDPRIVLGDIY